MKKGYQDLTDRLNRKWWELSMITLKANFQRLNVDELRFVKEMIDGYELFGEDFKPTTKQFNWFRQLANEVTSR